MENTELRHIAPARSSSRWWNRVVRLRRGAPGARTTVSGIATAPSTSVRDFLVNTLLGIIDDCQCGPSGRWANDEICRAEALLRKVRDAATDAEVAALLTGESQSPSSESR